MAIVTIYKEYATKEDAEKARQSILINYPREGYCTNLSVSEESGRWIIQGWRLESCD